MTCTSACPLVDCLLQAQHLSAMRLQHHVMKKCQDQMLKQIEELLCQKRHLSERLVGASLNHASLVMCSMKTRVLDYLLGLTRGYRGKPWLKNSDCLKLRYMEFRQGLYWLVDSVKLICIFSWENDMRSLKKQSNPTYPYFCSFICLFVIELKCQGKWHIRAIVRKINHEFTWTKSNILQHYTCDFSSQSTVLSEVNRACSEENNMTWICFKSFSSGCSMIPLHHQFHIIYLIILIPVILTHNSPSLLC